MNDCGINIYPVVLAVLLLSPPTPQSAVEPPQSPPLSEEETKKPNIDTFVETASRVSRYAVVVGIILSTDKCCHTRSYHRVFLSQNSHHTCWILFCFQRKIAGLL
jgi:hypothetical protein